MSPYRRQATRDLELEADHYESELRDDFKAGEGEAAAVVCWGVLAFSILLAFTALGFGWFEDPAVQEIEGTPCAVVSQGPDRPPIIFCQ